ncbi:hypothetical protein [Streptomyces cinereoruber]|uniref:hypothetical protein n=1 Tax=Streptomyces cinereoruber TaxID=67260 RepID=UPI003640AF81
MAYEDRTYHGIQGAGSNEDGWQPARLLVEKPEFGPTQRENVKVLRELPEPEDSGGFGWGYDGTGTSHTAAALLADALDLGDPAACGIAFIAHLENQILIQLREDFCDDVLSQLCDEWRLRRGVILRWSRAWYLQHGITDLPTALRGLPTRTDTDT